MDQIVLIAAGVLLFVFIILVIRVIGAWMLRIDEVIGELRKLNKTMNEIKSVQNSD